MIAKRARGNSLPGACALLAVAALACATVTESRDPAEVQLEIEARIAELETAIHRDRERIEILLNEPSAPESPPLHANPELHEIAHRLPALQRELAALRARDKSGASRPAPP